MNFWNQTIVKSTRGQLHKTTGEREPHRCPWCNTDIAIGEPAVKFASDFEGDFYHGYLHPECLRASDEMTRIEREPVEFAGQCTRGRMDDEDLPPEFPATLEGLE